VDHVRTDPSGTVDHVARDQASADSSPTDSTEQRVAGYEILSVLGRGAMGVVYKARQRGLKRLVALKMILSGEHASEHDVGRFRTEAEAVARLQHANIVQIYEVGEDNGRPFFSLEYIDGTSLDRKLKGTPLKPEQSAVLLRDMAEAMAYAHAHGVIHRDLKPANILLTGDGVPKIGDFGLAKRIDEEESGLTRTGAILGTPSYMPPEQALGLATEVGPLSDVYSLGAILYEMLTGRPPFRGTGVLDTLNQLRTREPVPPSQLQAGVPRDLETICLKCLQKDRTRRYAGARELADDMKRFLAGEPILARPVSQAERAWRWCKRNPSWTAAIASFVVVIVGWAISASLLWRQAEHARARETEARIEADNQKTQAIQAGERQRETATVSIKQLMELVARLYGRLQNRRLSTQATTEVRQLRAAVLNDLTESLTAVSKQIRKAATTTFADLVAAQQRGDLLKDLGQVEEAKAVYREGHKAALERVEAEPDNDRARGNLGVMETRLGHVAMELEGDARTARTHYEEARRLHEEIRTQPHGTQYNDMEIKLVVAHDDMYLGEALLALGQPAAARERFLEALTYREQEYARWQDPKDIEPRGYAMETRMWLGTASWHLDDARGVQEHFAEALRLGNGLIQRAPHFAPFKADLAEVLGAQGDALARLGKPQEAEKAYQEALRNLNEYFTKKADDVTKQPLLALTHERLGSISAQLGKDAEARKHYQEALKLRTELLQVESNNRSRKMAYLVALAHAGKYSEAVGFALKIRPEMEKSTELMLQVARVCALGAAGDPAGKARSLEQGLAALEAATREDYKDTVALLTDPDLAALREEARFQKLIAQIKAR
jgi:serine/threonine-protein kinase